MEVVSQWKSHGGTQGVYRHTSHVCSCDMTFAVFLPPQIADGPCPVVWYLSGLTCTHANVMEKGEYRRAAADLGLIVICPDTSPRGENIADDESWQLGTGAGFYVDAIADPWKQHYRMYTYVTKELPSLIEKNFAADMEKQGIFGHSMGGHGALTIALKHPETYRSCSAFSPIVQPSTADWSVNALGTYLGGGPDDWREYDACALVADGARFSEFLIDQGSSDEFLDEGLRPWLFEEACKDSDIPLTLRMQEGYDHSYYFISTFMADHLNWHADRLK